MIPHIKTNTTVTFVTPEGIPQQFSMDHPSAEEMLAIIQSPNASIDQDWEELQELLIPRNRLRRIINQSGVELSMDEYGDVVCLVDDTEMSVDRSLIEEILEIYEQKGNIKPLIAFLRHLADNPRQEVADELWGFMKVCGLTLTEDGHFIAYKNVNNNYTSIHDGVTDNTPGTRVEMRRSAVQHDPNVTCSRGLHFAAWGYLQHYAPGRKTVLLKISPADVVSIPSDYNNMKGRACAYEVLREVRQPEELKTVRIYKE